jgi:hypothetical protein
MIVPFQMVMFSMSKIANMLHLDNPIGIIVLYLGFGAGLSVFIFAGFIKSIPLEIEEAATIDGCNPIQTFFLIVTFSDHLYRCHSQYYVDLERLSATYLVIANYRTSVHPVLDGRLWKH